MQHDVGESVHEAYSAQILALRQEIARLESLLSDKASLDNLVQTKLQHVKAGDVVFVYDQLIFDQWTVLKDIASKTGCIFVSIPNGGVDSLREATPEELLKLGLQRNPRPPESIW